MVLNPASKALGEVLKRVSSLRVGQVCDTVPGRRDTWPAKGPWRVGQCVDDVGEGIQMCGKGYALCRSNGRADAVVEDVPGEVVWIMGGEIFVEGRHLGVLVTVDNDNGQGGALDGERPRHGECAAHISDVIEVSRAIDDRLCSAGRVTVAEEDRGIGVCIGDGAQGFITRQGLCVVRGVWTVRSAACEGCFGCGERRGLWRESGGRQQYGGELLLACMERLLQCLPGLLAVAFTEDGVWVVEDGLCEREGSIADGEVRFAVVFEGPAAPRDECEGGYVVDLRAEEADESIGGVGEPGVLHVEEGRAARGEPESSGESGEIGLVRGGDESQPRVCGRERLKSGGHGTRDPCDFPNACGGELFEELACVRKARLVGKRGGHGVR